MTKYFLYYRDDQTGDYELFESNISGDITELIENKLKTGEFDIDDFKLIYGKELKIIGKERIKTVEIEI